MSFSCPLTKQFRQMEHRRSMLSLVSLRSLSFRDTNLCSVESRGSEPSLALVTRMTGALRNPWSWQIKTDRISGYLAKRAMKNFAAGGNDNRFIYSVSSKTRKREDWTWDRRKSKRKPASFISTLAKHSSGITEFAHIFVVVN